MHLLADAGYKIWGHMLTPYPESEAVEDRRKRVYNRLHSRTRIAVECAFGRLKNRFRILLGKLEQKTPERIFKFMVSIRYALQRTLETTMAGLRLRSSHFLVSSA
ncbi:hypothetical protein PI124_g4758 [Phytophthora idaei]|nr:hypothetical protein PI124_g4758 [Phytophthora idaei]